MECGCVMARSCTCSSIVRLQPLPALQRRLDLLLCDGLCRPGLFVTGQLSRCSDPDPGVCTLVAVRG